MVSARVIVLQGTSGSSDVGTAPTAQGDRGTHGHSTHNSGSSCHRQRVSGCTPEQVHPYQVLRLRVREETCRRCRASAAVWAWSGAFAPAVPPP
ncbi:MAG: hypothetical protein [Circoviridae sp.]|nr:MAG: hypothetical protein [Circoviridae sp.]